MAASESTLCRYTTFFQRFAKSIKFVYSDVPANAKELKPIALSESLFRE